MGESRFAVVMVKRALKKVVQGAVATIVPATWRWRKSSLVILMYHRVLPADHPDRATEQPGMYVAPQTLAMHLATLREHFSFVHLDDWLDASSSGRGMPPRSCAITFDDGWRDNYDHAFPVLRAAQVPATIYLVSDLVGTSYAFWPNMLARLLAAGDERVLARARSLLGAMPATSRGFDAAQIDAIIVRCKSRSDAEMQALVAQVSGDAGATSGVRDLMNWAEIEEMQQSGLVRFGSHTRRHTRLSKLPAGAQLDDEVRGSRDALAQHLRGQPRTFCYPNGDVSALAIETVRQNYSGAVTTRRGWNDRGSDIHALKRIGVHEDVANARAAFLARLAGVG